MRKFRLLIQADQGSDEVYRYFSQTQNLEGWSDQEASGYLADFLAAFDIPIESQVLVFSKTSLQASRITPANPRAIYFNDDLYVAWVPGSKMLEITAPSPHVGTNFYSLDRQGGQPRLERETDRCLRCHGDTFTRDVPGLFVQSVFPDETGQPIYKAGTKLIDASTPIEDRWGGWLVTGAKFPHRGNRLYRETTEGALPLRTINLTDVPEHGYLTRRSDVVALLVLDHQTQAHTLIASLAIETRKALHDQIAMDEILKRTEPVSDSTGRRIKSQGDRLLKCLFFVDEAEVPSINWKRSRFAKKFQSDRPRTPQDQSLYQLRLNGRLFEYPLSYLVYSNAFNELPKEATDYLWKEIERILSSPIHTEGYEHLSQMDKKDIHAILRATHPHYLGH